MKQAGRKLRIGIRIKLYQGPTLVLNARKRLKSRIVDLIDANSFSECIVKVKYGKDIFNSGIYTSKQDAKDALKAFTEKSLLDYIDSWF